MLDMMTDTLKTPEGRLRTIQNDIAKMPSLSTTVTKVLEICNRPDTSPNDLNRVISLDPVLTGQVLKLVNSAYYSLPNQVSSLTRAIIMLGLNTVKNLALSTAVLQSIGKKNSFQALSMEQFWTHCLTVGVTAKRLAAAQRVPVSEREEYFVAGLLHDLGKIPLNNRFPDEYLQAMKMAEEDQGSLYRFESSVFGINHCIVGRLIAEKWKLSPMVTDSLSLHHHPHQAGEETFRLLSTIALSNTYSHAIQKGDDDRFVSENQTILDLLDKVNLSLDLLLELKETVSEEVDKAKIFLQVSGKG